MKVFVSFRYTGADQQSLHQLLSVVCDDLTSNGITPYCTLFFEEEFQNKGLTTQEIFDVAFQQLSSSDAMLVILASNEKSEGMLLEIGYALAKSIPIVLAKQTQVTQTYLPRLLPNMLHWDTVDDLVQQLRKAKSLFATVASL